MHLDGLLKPLTKHTHTHTRQYDQVVFGSGGILEGNFGVSFVSELDLVHWAEERLMPPGTARDWTRVSSMTCAVRMVACILFLLLNGTKYGIERWFHQFPLLADGMLLSWLS